MASEVDTFSYRAQLRADPGALERISTLLTAWTDCVGTELVDRDVDQRTDADEMRHEAGTLIAYFERPETEADIDIRADIERALERTETAGYEIVECARYTDDSWRESWKEFFDPLRLSERIGVGPPWRSEEIPRPEGGAGLVVDPGMAFGTGSHETTQLAAALLDASLDAYDGPRVLDVGCGSAILSMVAASLGASSVYGIDIEPEAIQAARENIQRNELSDSIAVSTEPLAGVGGHWELVVANILAHILLDLEGALYDRVADDGRLIVSGIPSDRADDFVANFLRDDWQVSERRRMADWTAFVLRRA